MVDYARKGWFISDRSGFEYPISQMIEEPGTGYIIAKSESDGIYNLVDHPQNFIKGHADTRVVKNARPEVEEEPSFITLEDGTPLEAGFMFGVTEPIELKE